MTEDTFKVFSLGGKGNSDDVNQEGRWEIEADWVVRCSLFHLEMFKFQNPSKMSQNKLASWEI